MNFSSWTNVLEQISERLAPMLPVALGATGLLVVGWIAAILARFLTRKIIVAAVARINRHSSVWLKVSAERDSPRMPHGSLERWYIGSCCCSSWLLRSTNCPCRS